MRIRALSTGNGAPRNAAVVERRARRGAWLGLVAVVALVVTACSSDDRYLPALLADPMASYEANGVQLVRSEERPRGTDLVTRKPITARVTRHYELEQQDDADQVFEDALAAAETAGWDFGDQTPTESFGGLVISASKGFDWGPAELTVGIGPTPGEPESDVKMRIWLDE